MSNRTPFCPDCSVQLKSITYGMPTEEDFNDPNFFSGGCIISLDSPDLICPNCRAEFLTRPGSQLVTRADGSA